MTFRFVQSARFFAKSERGYITLEGLIVLPVLLFILGAAWVYYDAFRQQSVNQKANYTIGDMISRETEPLNADYLTNARDLLRSLTLANDNDTDLRVTVVRYDADGERWDVMWSEQRGDQSVLQTPDLDGYATRLPLASDGDQLILVETWDLYDPVFSVGLASFEIRSYSFTRPRFAPQILYAG